MTPLGERTEIKGDVFYLNHRMLNCPKVRTVLYNEELSRPLLTVMPPIRNDRKVIQTHAQHFYYTLKVTEKVTSLRP